MPEQSVEGLALSSKPLGENDRLLTLVTDQEGLLRLAVPGARRPKSSLAGAVPLAHLRLQVGGGSGLQRVRQLKTLHNYSQLGQRLETLSAAQALAELCLALVPTGTPVPGILGDVLMQLGRLEELVREHGPNLEALRAMAEASSIPVIASGGIGTLDNPIEIDVASLDIRNSGSGDTATHTYGAAGVFTVTLVVTDSTCGTADTTTFTVTSHIGLDENALGQTLAAFPNPNTGVFTVRIAGNEAFEGQLEVLNVMGQVVTATSVDKRSASLDVNLDLRDYAKGIYMVRLSGSEGQAVLRVVVR